MATIIGKVTKVVGMAIVVDEQGKRHVLKEGESLHAGERLITSAGTVVTVVANGNETVVFQESQTIKLTEQIVDSNVSDSSENVVNQAVFKEILAALNAGQDIGYLLDAPAAGGTESDGDTSFVSLDRIATVAGAQNFLDGGQRVSSPIPEFQSINLRYFPITANTISNDLSGGGGGGGGGGVTKLEGIVESLVASVHGLLQVGGDINTNDSSKSLVNANALIGLLTDSIHLTDNSVSLVNTDAVAGILSGPMTIEDNSTSLLDTGIAANILSGATSVTDKSISLVNTGVVTGVLSGNTTALDQSVSAINTGVVAGVLSGDTTSTDQSNSLLNTDTVLGLLSGNTTAVDHSNSLVDTGVVAGLLSGNTTVTDQSTSLVNAGVLGNVLSGNAVLNDQSSAIVNAVAVPSLLSGSTTVNENSSSSLLDLAVIPSVLSGATNVKDNSNSLIDVDIVSGVLSGPVSFQDESSSPIDVDLLLGLLDTSGNLITADLNVHVAGLLDIGLSLDPAKPFISITPAEGDFTSILDGVLGELSGGTQQLNSVPDPLAITTRVLDKTLNGIFDTAHPLSAGDLLDIDNVLEVLPSSLTNTTNITSEVLSLIAEPILLNTLTLQLPVVDNG